MYRPSSADVTMSSDPFTPTGVYGGGPCSRVNGGVRLSEPRRLMDNDASKTLENDQVSNEIDQLYFKGGSHHDKGTHVNAMHTKLLSKIARAENKTSTPIGDDDVQCQKTGRVQLIG